MIYRRIEALCFSRGMTLQEACKAAGLSRSTYLTWKRGVIPTKTTLNKLAQVLGTTADYIHYGPVYMDAVKEDNIYVKALLEEMLRMDMDKCRKLLAYARQINATFSGDKEVS